MIIYNAIITVLLIASFLMCLKAFAIGLDWGKKLSNNTTPSININPIAAVEKQVNTIKDSVDAKKMQEEINNIFAYNADIATNTLMKGG